MKSLKDEFYMQSFDNKRIPAVPMRVENYSKQAAPFGDRSVPYMREHTYLVKFGRKFTCLDADLHDAMRNTYLDLKEYLYGDIQAAFLQVERAAIESGATYDRDVKDAIRNMRELLEEI